MLLRLLILFTVLPLVELYLLILLTRKTNLLVTILAVLGTGVVGAVLARRQGFNVLVRINNARGPLSDALLDGALIVLAGVLMITPGLLTDALGLTLLVPPIRTLCKRQLANWVRARTVVQVTTTYSAEPGSESAYAETSSETVIDAEFTRHPSGDD